MAENIKMTRIADLGEAPSFAPVMGSNGYPQQSNDYMTMNVHSNPYGIPPPSNEGLPPPIARPPSQNQSQQYPPPPSLPSQPNNMPPQMYQEATNPQYTVSPEQLAMAQQQMLPSRDIPQNMAQHIQDEQIRANYIPPPKRTDDFIKEYDKQMEHKLKEYEKEKRNESKIDRAFDKFRNPIIAAILFFILHMPIVNTMVFKQFSFLSIYNDDGNFNLYGLILKAAIFGGIYWFVESALDYLGEL